MGDLRDRAQASARGGLQLLAGNAISSLILAVGTIPIIRILGPELFGLYSLTLTIPLLLTDARDLGTSAAITRFAARFKSSGGRAAAIGVVKRGAGLSISTSMALTAGIYLLSPFLAPALTLGPSGTLLAQTASLMILAAGGYVTLQAILTGFEEMRGARTMMVIRAIAQTLLGLSLVWAGLEVMGALVGSLMGYVVASVAGLLAVRYVLARPEAGKSDGANQVPTTLGLVRYGLPLSIAGTLERILPQIYILILAAFVGQAEVGNFSAATKLGGVLSILVFAVQGSLLPAFSKFPPGGGEGISSFYRLSVRYTSVMIMPSAILLMSVSEPLVFLLIGEEYASAVPYLVLYLLLYLTVAVGNFVNVPLLNGMGFTSVTLKSTLLNFLISFSLGVALAGRFGGLGVLLAMLAGFVAGSVYASWSVSNLTGAGPDFRHGLKLLSLALLAGGASFAAQTIAGPSHPLVLLLIGIAVFSGVLLVALPRTGTITKKDLDAFEELAGHSMYLAPVKRILKIERALLPADSGERK